MQVKPPTFFTLSPDNLGTTYRGSITGPLVYDLASRVVPQFSPKVNNGAPTAPNYNVDKIQALSVRTASPPSSMTVKAAKQRFRLRLM